MSKVMKVLSIFFNHLVVFLTFLSYLLLIGFIEDSILNLVSLIIVLTLLIIYMHRGLKPLLKWWIVLQYWTAFVFLTALSFQFLATTQFGPDLYDNLSLR
jgi:hypothetical protein